MLGAQEELSDDEFLAMFDTNVFGAMRLTRSVLPVMRAAGRGRLVHVSSVSGLIPSPFMGAYGATKHALEGWSLSLDHEVRPFGIRSVLVRPGFIRTRIAENSVSVDRSLPDYAPVRARFDTVLRKALVDGEDPSCVAETGSRALAARHPRAVYLAGNAARRILAVRAIAPRALFDHGATPFLFTVLLSGHGLVRLARLDRSGLIRPAPVFDIPSQPRCSGSLLLHRGAFDHHARRYVFPQRHQ